MARHPQLTQQQMADQLDHAHKELEAWSEKIDTVYDPKLNPKFDESVVYADMVLVELQERIKTLIERLSEYK